MAYTKTNWVNDQAPAIDATNLNKIETGIAESRNVALLAVDSTAPEHCSEGDLYYNTTTKKIYEAIDTDVWDSTGVDPIGDILYIIFSTKTTYSYDGTDLVSVGGGGAEVSVSTTQPTEDEILWINPEDVPSGALNPITNEYSVAQDKGYSCNYVNNANTYSTSEVKTDKVWIDGKPIYRKVISFSTSPTINSWDYIQHQIQNMDKPMPTCSMMVMYNGSWYYCPNDLVIEMYINTTNIAYYNNSNALADKPAFAVIEYTKTTD